MVWYGTDDHNSSWYCTARGEFVLGASLFRWTRDVPATEGPKGPTSCHTQMQNPVSEAPQLDTNSRCQENWAPSFGRLTLDLSISSLGFQPAPTFPQPVLSPSEQNEWPPLAFTDLAATRCHLLWLMNGLAASKIRFWWAFTCSSETWKARIPPSPFQLVHQEQLSKKVSGSFL